LDAREELLKITIGRTVTGLLLLIGFLCAIIWRGTLFQKWTQAVEGLSKPALMAALGLVLIGAALEALLIAYLVYLLYRRGRTPALTEASALPALTEPQMLKRYGLLWDAEQNPHCPADKTLLVFQTCLEATEKYGTHDYLRCLTCKQSMPIYDSSYGYLTLHDAQTFIRTSLQRDRLSD